MAVDTFAQWFARQAGRQDATGWLSRAWNRAEGDRPKASGVAGITRWLCDPANAGKIALPSGDIEQASAAAAEEYRTARLQAELGGDNPATGEPAWLGPLRGQLSRIEGYLTSGPGAPAGGVIVPQEWLASVAESLDAMQRWQAQQDERIAPVTKLLAELGEAEHAADAMDGLRDQQPGGSDPAWRGVGDDETGQPDVSGGGVPYPPQPRVQPQAITDAGTDPVTGEFVTRFADGTESRYMPQPPPAAPPAVWQEGGYLGHPPSGGLYGRHVVRPQARDEDGSG